MRNSSTVTIKHDERGFASIVVALTLVIVLALITVGFAQLARREQQNALSKQLASQAYDAAETGINDAVQYIHLHPTAVYIPNHCDTNVATAYSPNLDAQNGVSYSCLMINDTPSNLYYSGVQPGANEGVRFTTSSTTPPNLETMTIEWDSADKAHGRPSTNSGFSPVSTWNSPAAIEFSLTPLGSGTVDRNSLVNDTFTTYLYPVTAGGPGPTPSTVAYNTAPGNQGNIAQANCAATGANSSRCLATITGIPGTSPGGYLIHFLNLYDVSNITISGAVINPVPGPVNFVGGQVLIDSTGKAQDVLKRLEVRVAINPLASLPDYAVSGQNICKRMETLPNPPPGIPLYITTGGVAAAPPDPCYLSN
jgi:hypothetical protein